MQTRITRRGLLPARQADDAESVLRIVHTRLGTPSVGTGDVPAVGAARAPRWLAFWRAFIVDAGVGGLHAIRVRLCGEVFDRVTESFEVGLSEGTAHGT